MRKIASIGGYDPKCSQYKRVQRGKVMYYVSYYLPNRKRVQRPVHQDFNQAKLLVRKKEMQLIKGLFDAKDHEKLGAYFVSRQNRYRLSIEVGLHVYFEEMKAIKTSKTYRHELRVINQCFDFLKNQGWIYFDEIHDLDVKSLITWLDSKGMSASTIIKAIRMVQFVYNFLIDEVELLYGKYFVPKRVNFPKTSALVRNRFPSDDEINALLKAIQNDELSERHSNLPSSSIVPLGNIIQFLVFTGARIGEVLHAEWSDFDLENGIWRIGNNPNCPTIDGFRSVSRWRKPREVILCPEALNLIRSIEKVKTVGKVAIRDQNYKIVDHKIYPAQYVFPRKKFLKQEDGKVLTQYSRVDSIRTHWRRLLKRAGIEDLQIHDLRRYFNHKLRTSYGLP